MGTPAKLQMQGSGLPRASYVADGASVKEGGKEGVTGVSLGWARLQRSLEADAYAKLECALSRFQWEE